MTYNIFSMEEFIQMDIPDYTFTVNLTDIGIIQVRLFKNFVVYLDTVYSLETATQDNYLQKLFFLDNEKNLFINGALI